MRTASRAALLSLCGAACLAQSATPEPRFKNPTFAPPAPPVQERADAVDGRLKAAAATVYSIGDPTPEEQLYVEYINRARANPQAEALLLANSTDPDVADQRDRAWQVDLNQLLSQFSIYSPAQPLAISPALTRAARRHTADMLANVFQGHDGTDGSNPATRVNAEGYAWMNIGENVFSTARSVFQGHAGFEIDWGPGQFGMQTPPGHRNTIHNGAFREVGVGVIFGSGQSGEREVGPQLVTQEFGTAQGSTPFITGVAYFDVNGNNFYDVGEGIGGLTVKINGVATEGVTALSGGYAVPVPGNGSYTVTFSGQGFAGSSQSEAVSGQLNRKLDFRPPYAAPTVSGPASPAAGRANSYSISATPGAKEYRWRVFRSVPAAVEGAENGGANVAINQTAGYSVIQSELKASGSSAFHLVHPAAGPRSQYVTLNPAYPIGDGSALSFQSRLGWAAPDQRALVQVSTNEGATWQTIYNQAGSGGRGETSFNQRTVSLAAYAGRSIRLRFVYDFNSGSFFNQTNADVGWTFDDISVSNAEQVSDEVIATAAADGSFAFTPAVPGKYVLQGAVRTGHTFLPYGTEKVVNAVEGGNVPEFRISRVVRAGAEIELTVDLLGGSLTSGLAAESKASLGDPWAAANATVQPVSATRHLVRVAASGPVRFFRIKAN